MSTEARVHGDEDRNEDAEFVQALDTQAALAQRDRAILQVIVATGLKVDEILRADVKDVNRKRGTLDLDYGSSVHQYRLGSAIRSVVEYLEYGWPVLLSRHSQPEDVTALFVSPRGRRLKRASVASFLARLRRLLALDRETGFLGPVLEALQCQSD